MFCIAIDLVEIHLNPMNYVIFHHVSDHVTSPDPVLF